MANSPTQRIRAVKQETGSGLNVWGTTLNDQALDLIDEAVQGVETIALTGGTATLTSTNYASDEARNMGFRFTGTGGNVVYPGVECVKVVVNDCSAPIIFGYSAGSGVTIPASGRAVVQGDGTTMRQVVGTDQGGAKLTGLATGTASTDAVTKGQMDTAILAAAIAPGTLPARAGNSGKYLRVTTDETGVEWSEVDIAGGAGGAAITIATTLTSTSSRVQTVAMASNSQSVTLPDATTLDEGGPIFVFQNTGTRAFGVRNSAGTLLGAVAPGGVVSCFLNDNGSIAGGWGLAGVGYEPWLVICDNTFSSTYTTSVEVAVKLTDTLSLHFVRNSSGHPFVVAVDHSTYPATVGTPALIVASNVAVSQGFRINDGKALIYAGATVYNVTVAGTTCTVSSGHLTDASASAFSFTGQPLVAQLTAGVFVQLWLNGNVFAEVIDATGSTPTSGAATSALGTTSSQALGCYRVSDTTALALYIDDSGTAGTPFSIRGVVLSVSGTTITVGTSAGVNDVVSAVVLPSCQLSATSYVVGYYQASGTLVRAVHVGVSGTTVTFGTPLTVETLSLADQAYTDFNASRFQPNLYALSGTTALFTFGNSGTGAASRHVVLTNSSGTLSAGTILYSLWSQASGGNFPQTSSGFLAFSTATAENQIHQVDISGTALSVAGTLSPSGATTLSATSTLRFGLSGGVQGIATATQLGGRVLLARPRAGNAPQFLGALTLPNSDWGTVTNVPVELASNRAAFTYTTQAQTAGASTPQVKLTIVEFAP